jgi:WD40 repeat protein
MPADWLIVKMSFNQSGDILVMCFNNGEIRLVNINTPDRYMVIKQHDAHAGGITAAKFSFDERCLLTTGKDGMFFVHAIDKNTLIAESKFNPLEGVAGIDFMPEA